ncbi:MAG: hypothetical protein V4737_07410 [Curtobacterium sp.]
MTGLIVIAISIALSGCATGAVHGPESVGAAKAQAVAELRSVLTLARDTWPQDVPRRVAHDCEVDGRKAVQFSYFVEVERPDDPEALVERTGAHWKREGYELPTTHTEMDAETGAVSAVVARATDKPRASIAATKVRVNVYSLCVAR